MPNTSNPRAFERIPPAALLHFAAMLTGFATAFLGPSLPVISTALRLSDQRAGALLAAQFTGAFLGGWFTRAPLFRCMNRGFAAAAAGFGVLGLAVSRFSSLPLTAVALLFLGFGVGQIITSNNLLAVKRWTQHRGAALTLLNFTWSAGALSAPLLLPALFRHCRVQIVFTSLGLALGLGLLANLLSAKPDGGEAAIQTEVGTLQGKLDWNRYVYYCLLLFLYGGVETSLSGWLTTYDLRYGKVGFTIAASAAAFWFCLTGARAITSGLLLRLPERFFVRGGLLLTLLSLAGLLLGSPNLLIPGLAGLAGIGLAPWFPLIFSGMMTEHPTPVQAGRVVAISGMGAAALPWLVGQISTHTGSLRYALTAPAFTTLLLLLLSQRQTPKPTTPV